MPSHTWSSLLRNNGMSVIRYGATREACSFYPQLRVGLVQLLNVNRAANGQLIAGGLGVEVARSHI